MKLNYYVFLYWIIGKIWFICVARLALRVARFAFRVSRCAFGFSGTASPFQSQREI